MVSPTPVAQSIKPGELEKTSVGPTRPPGYYGAGDYRRSLNLSPGLASLKRMEGLPSGVDRSALRAPSVWDLKPWLLLFSFLLLVADGFITLIMRGLLPDFSLIGQRLKGAGRSAVSIFSVIFFLWVCLGRQGAGRGEE
ncbi:MAG: hypothetical protein ACJ0HN_04070 [Alphaproteobacteria bacterium]